MDIAYTVVFEIFPVIAPPIGRNCSNLVCDLILTWCACVPNFVMFGHCHIQKPAFVRMNVVTCKHLINGIRIQLHGLVHGIKMQLYGLLHTQMCVVCI